MSLITERDKTERQQKIQPLLPPLLRTYLKEKGLSYDQIDDTCVEILELYLSVANNPDNNFIVDIGSSGALRTYKRREDF